MNRGPGGAFERPKRRPAQVCAACSSIFAPIFG